MCVLCTFPGTPYLTFPAVRTHLQRWISCCEGNAWTVTAESWQNCRHILPSLFCHLSQTRSRGQQLKPQTSVSHLYNTLRFTKRCNLFGKSWNFQKKPPFNVTFTKKQPSYHLKEAAGTCSLVLVHILWLQLLNNHLALQFSTILKAVHLSLWYCTWKRPKDEFKSSFCILFFITLLCFMYWMILRTNTMPVPFIYLSFKWTIQTTISLKTKNTFLWN